MPTTAPTARKQYGLRWLFAVTALVGVLLGINRYYIGTAFTIEHKVHLIRTNLEDGVGMTKAETEQILGTPRESYRVAHTHAVDIYPGGTKNIYVVVYLDETGRVLGKCRAANKWDWRLDSKVPP